MKNQSGTLRKTSFSFGLLFLTALQSCQSSTPGDVLNVESSKVPASSPQSVAVNGELIGQGQTRISIVVATNAVSPTEARDMRNGAALALKDLDNGEMSIEIVPANGGEAAVSEKALEAFVKGSAAIAYAGAAPSAGVSNTILQIALLPNGSVRPAGSLAFLPSTADSLEAGIKHGLANGAKGVIVLSPVGQSIAGIQQMVGRLKSTAPVELIEYSSGESADAIAAKAAAKPGFAFAFAGNGQEIPAIAGALRTRLGQQSGLQIIGNGNWTKSALLPAPSLEGAIVAMPDFSNENMISANYRKEYGTLPGAMSLYAYDLVAILAGITRAKGREGLTDGTIRSKAGFRGVTGAFRFRDDGSVERLFEIQQLRGGRSVAAAGSQPGF